ncbi:MAG: hypothetical protein KKF44_02465 [Nanoarchaeota archaeon]|nr:hypothetical protein [Nanoarchaeota archaeon]
MEPYYEKLDFDEDPFSTNPKRFLDCLIRLNDVSDEMFYRIESGNMLVIAGNPGSGRTSLLMKAAKKFGGKKKVIYVDSLKVDKNLNISNLLFDRFGLLGRILKKKPKNMILLLDNVNNLTRVNNDRIKYYFDQDYFKSIIFTCEKYSQVKFSDSLKDRIGKRVVNVPDLDEQDAVELIRSRIGNSDLLTDELIKFLFNQSGCNPKKMLENSAMIAERIAKSSRTRIKYIDIKRILGGKNE